MAVYNKDSNLNAHILEAISKNDNLEIEKIKSSQHFNFIENFGNLNRHPHSSQSEFQHLEGMCYLKSKQDLLKYHWIEL